MLEEGCRGAVAMFVARLQALFGQLLDKAFQSTMPPCLQQPLAPSVWLLPLLWAATVAVTLAAAVVTLVLTMVLLLLLLLSPSLSNDAVCVPPS